MPEAEAASLWVDGATYESYVGRWSRLVGPQFLRWLGVPPGARWLDVGCGTGALTAAILDSHEPREVLGVDRSQGFVGHARAHIVDARAAFEVGDAQVLPVPGQHFDAVVSGLVLNFIPDPGSALAELRRVCRPGGTVGVYVWDYAGEMQLMRHFWDAARELDPVARELDEGQRCTICEPAALGALLGQHLEDVATTEVVVPTVFRDFDDYWSPFLGGQAPAPAYCMSLDEASRARLRERLRERLPIAVDGSIALTARAWAAKGRCPTS